MGGNVLPQLLVFLLLITPKRVHEERFLCVELLLLLLHLLHLVQHDVSPRSSVGVHAHHMVSVDAEATKGRVATRPGRRLLVHHRANESTSTKPIARREAYEEEEGCRRAAAHRGHGSGEFPTHEPDCCPLVTLQNLPFNFLERAFWAMNGSNSHNLRRIPFEKLTFIISATSLCRLGKAAPLSLRSGFVQSQLIEGRNRDFC